MKSFFYVFISIFLFFNIVSAQNNVENKIIEKQTTEAITDFLNDKQKENEPSKNDTSNDEGINTADKDDEYVLKNDSTNEESSNNTNVTNSLNGIEIDTGDTKLTPKEELKKELKEELIKELIKELQNNKKEDVNVQSKYVVKSPPKKEEVPVETKATTPITKENEDIRPYDINVLGVKITTLRKNTQETTAEARAEEASYKLEQIIKNRDIKKISIKPIKYGYSININDKEVFAILHGDAGAVIGKDKEKLKDYAKEAVQNIGVVIKQEKKKQDKEDFKNSIIKIVLAFILTVLVLLILKKLKVLADNSMEKWITALLEKIASTEFSHKYSRIFAVYLKRFLLFAYYFIIVFILYLDFAVVLTGIPLTKNWANGLLNAFEKILNSFYSGFIRMLPGLVIVVMIILGTKILVGLANIFFEGIENGHIQFEWIDKDTIVPTKRITAAFLWVIGVALAYPFIPGSGSDAFKGISVLIGVMFSIGSSNIMSQAISGLILIYTKGVKVGDFVTVKDYTGTILHTGVFTVKIKTPLQEEINIPNTLLLDSITTNYSTLKEEKGIALEIKLGLDYDVPWRQVNAMVLEAVKMTRSLRQDSKPNIFQSDMADYYMEYTVRTWIDRPELGKSIKSELYQNIQDVFNKYDVQIMTPRYLTIYKNKMVVPPDKWYLEPASHNEDDQIEVTGLYDAKNADGTPFLKRLNEKEEPKQEDSKQKESKHEEVKEEKKDDRANKKNSGKSKKS